MILRPLENKIILRIIREVKSISSIILTTRNAVKKHTPVWQGRIEFLSDKCKLGYKTGDLVYFNRYFGKEMNLYPLYGGPNDEWWIIREDDILIASEESNEYNLICDNI